MIAQIYRKLKAQNQLYTLTILLISNTFSIALISFRIYYTSTPTFKFLVWNLFLAWIPYGISLIFLLYEYRLKSSLLVITLTSIWLLFFPNSPYILTDLFHLGKKIYVPLWYDLILILSFAWNGLLLGFLSLANIQRFLSRRFNVVIGWLFALVALCLCAFGIYLGRFLRWNSWNIFTHPEAVFEDILVRILEPTVHKESLAMTLVFSIFLILTYLTFEILKGEKVNNIR